MSRRRLRAEEYTVGWVCALPIELAAAQEMLDEEHDDVEHDDNDDNIYSLGSVEGHNVAIACLPAGRAGNDPAAVVVTNLKATFKHIRFGLMVGIGGGVPTSEVDICLGDVVVSQADRDYGGVVKYDFGKATSGGFQRIGSLNSPPEILLNAVQKVRANDIRERSKICENISKISSKPIFKRENAGLDVLFEASYDHEGDQNQDGAEVCPVCRTEKQVYRESRQDEKVKVDYGTIASGNQLVRAASTRDSLSKKLGGVLCFEMEAAGLMNTFPCLVIRGICDYADSHKNKKWQAYAAATAAAYARELLSVIRPTPISVIQTTRDAMNG
ncbi:MAG: hypothetical protein Q9227_000560 [Pyrenula ochraceoflavens]